MRSASVVMFCHIALVILSYRAVRSVLSYSAVILSYRAVWSTCILSCGHISLIVSVSEVLSDTVAVLLYPYQTQWNDYTLWRTYRTQSMSNC